MCLTYFGKYSHFLIICYYVYNQKKYKLYIIKLLLNKILLTKNIHYIFEKVFIISYDEISYYVLLN